MINKILGNPVLNILIGIILGCGIYGLVYATGNLFTAFVAGGVYFHWIKVLESKREDFKSDKAGSWE